MANGNLVTTTGKKIALHRLFESSPSYTAPVYFKVGTGSNTPAITDTDLQTAILINGSASKAIASGYPVFDDTNLNATTRSILLTTDCNGNNISEFGLVNTDSSPVLFSRAVFTAVNKTSSIQLVILEKDVIQ